MAKANSHIYIGNTVSIITFLNVFIKDIPFNEEYINLMIWYVARNEGGKQYKPITLPGHII